jgi:hypothetical protein
MSHVKLNRFNRGYHFLVTVEISEKNHQVIRQWLALHKVEFLMGRIFGPPPDYILVHHELEIFPKANTMWGITGLVNFEFRNANDALLFKLTFG